SILLVWDKLNGYYIMLYESPLYPALIVFYLLYGLAYLEAVWDSEEQSRWVRRVKGDITRYFNKWYR
ncbi:hypothetical protein LY78DRAFT_595274, partial [Colletotrichum sublineola]